MFEGVASDELTDVMGQMHGVANAAIRVLMAGILEHDQRELWKIDAATSMAAWLEMRHGVSHATARQWVRSARALVFVPTIGQMFDDGHLSWDQLLSAIDLVAFGGIDEAEVAADAVGRSAAELERLAREARRVSREESEKRKDDESLRLRWDRVGMLQIHGRIADASGKVIENALRREAAKQCEDISGQLRPFDKKMADALFMLASARIATDADPDLATVVIHVEGHALDGGNDTMDLAKIELGPVISMATAHRLACDGRCQVVIDDLLGRTVAVAMIVHAVPRWLRRRVLDRDGCCRWPGCGRTALLHAHHIKWWTRDKGRTEEDNLAMLCWFHHHAVHEGGWEIEGDPRGRLRFIGPNGQIVQGGPPGLRDDIRDALGLKWATDPPAQAA